MQGTTFWATMLRCLRFARMAPAIIDIFAKALLVNWPALCVGGLEYGRFSFEVGLTQDCPGGVPENLECENSDFAKKIHCFGTNWHPTGSKNTDKKSLYTSFSRRRSLWPPFYPFHLLFSHFLKSLKTREIGTSR